MMHLSELNIKPPSGPGGTGPSWLSERTMIGAVLLVALGVRIYLVTGSYSWSPHTVDEGPGKYLVRGMRLSGDPGPTYDRIARNFLAGKGLVSDRGSFHRKRAPLYPLLLALTYSVFDRPLLAIGVVHAILGAGTCLLVWRTVRECFGRTPALIASAVVAVLPEFLKLTPQLYASTLLVFLSAAFVLSMFRSRGRRSIFSMVVPGALLGLVVLTRLELLVLLPGAVVWVLLGQEYGWRQRWARAIVFTLTVAVVISPWLVYNRTTNLSRLAKAGGAGLGWLWYNNNPWAQTCWEDPPWGPRGVARGLGAAQMKAARERIQASLGTDDPDVVNGYIRQSSIRFIRAHPLRIAELSLSRLLMLWNIWPTVPPSLLIFVLFWGFLGVAVVGAIVSRTKHETQLLLIMIILVSLFYGFIHGHPRYRLPAMPAVVMLFAVGATYLWRALTRRLVRRHPQQESSDAT